MFEVIGLISVFSFISLVLIFQYTIMSLGIIRHDTTKIGQFIGWVPLLPFILMLILGILQIFYYIYKIFKRWFELRWGWLFINGRKRIEWAKHLRNKYGNENDRGNISGN